ncbi:MAG: hypothetical protein QXF75_07670 [Candidatus Bathyarchaeia archaeon]
MKKKIVVIIALISLLAQCISLVHAQKSITAWTDKPIYNPGESGTLYIAFNNTRGGAVTVKKIVVFFEEWRAFKNGKWEGNKTLEINKALASGEVYSINTDFKVPTDGRAIDTTVEIEVHTEEVGVIDPQGPEAIIYVSQTPPYMAQMLSLITIHVVLMIVCTIIIAAVIFLSVRRPRAIWVEEEEKEKSEQP